MAASASAQTIVSTWDTLGADNVYYNGGGWTGTFGDGEWMYMGSSFVASTTGTLETFDAAIYAMNGGHPTVTIGFYSSVGGQLGSSLLDIDLPVANAYGSLLSISDISTNYGTLHLTAGTTYWVMLVDNTNVASGSSAWCFPLESKRNASGSLLYEVTGERSYYSGGEGGAMRVGVAIPEPSTYALWAGLLTLAFVVVRRRIRR